MRRGRAASGHSLRPATRTETARPAWMRSALWAMNRRHDQALSRPAHPARSTRRMMRTGLLFRGAGGRLRQRLVTTLLVSGVSTGGLTYAAPPSPQTTPAAAELGAAPPVAGGGPGQRTWVLPCAD